MSTVGLGLLADRPLPDLARAAAAAEAAGIEGIWVPDERFFRDPYPALTAIAAATQRVRLGPCVTDPFVRHPALTAMAVGTLQDVSGGRAVLGIGAGISGFRPLEITHRQTTRAVRDAVGLVRHLLAGERAEVTNDVFRFRGRLDFAASPVPVYIAGRGPKILELAGEIADGVIIGSLASPSGLRYAEERIASGARRAGRPLQAVRRMMWLHTYLSKDHTAARDAARRIVLAVLQSSRSILPGIGVVLSPHLADLVESMPYGYHWRADARALQLIPSDLVDAFTAAGTPEVVAAKIADLIAHGIDHVALRLWTVDGQTADEALGLVTGRVLPLLGGRIS